MGTNVFLSGNVSSGLTELFDSFLIVGAMLVKIKKQEACKLKNCIHIFLHSYEGELRERISVVAMVLKILFCLWAHLKRDSFPSTFMHWTSICIRGKNQSSFAILSFPSFSSSVSQQCWRFSKHLSFCKPTWLVSKETQFWYLITTDLQWNRGRSLQSPRSCEEETKTAFKKELSISICTTKWATGQQSMP